MAPDKLFIDFQMDLKELLSRFKKSRRTVLLIVFIALFLDLTLLTAIVPIIPEYLFRHWYPDIADKLLNPCVATTTNSGKKYGGLGNETSDLAIHIYQEELIKNRTSSGEKQKEKCNITEHRILKHKLMLDENIWITLMFAAKPFAQLFINPCVGQLINKIGYTIPMFVGFVVLFFSTIMFAFGTSYGMLLFTRVFQGFGSASTSTAGMGMLAQAYPDDQERGAAMGIAFSGLALGVLVGPTYGGFLYSICGKALPFILLAVLALVDGVLQFFVLRPRIDKHIPQSTTFKELITDPYIVIAAGALIIGNLGIAILEPCLPIWMMENMGSEAVERGAVFLPSAVSLLIGTNIFGRVSHKFGRWLCGLVGLIIIGIALIMISLMTLNTLGLLIAMSFNGIGLGMIDASMIPQMAFLVDIRHVGVYGNIYAITGSAFSLAFALGPLISGPMVRQFGFPIMLYIIACVNFVYAPIMVFLRNPTPAATEKLVL